jgi:thiol-disulfide isomerase/thioredoxin
MKTTVELYYANWCGHCVKFKPKWDEISKELNSNGVETMAYEYDLFRDVMDKEDIKSFPTIKININGKKFVHTGERSFEGFMKAIKQQRGGAKLEYKAKYEKYKAKYLELVN